MNYKLALNALLLVGRHAYERRDEIALLLGKVDAWRRDKKKVTEPSKLSVEERITQLESLLNEKEQIIETQSELIAELSKDLESLSASTAAIHRRLKQVAWLALLALVLILSMMAFALFAAA